MIDISIARHVAVFQHYFRRVFHKAGLEWGPENDDEITKAFEYMFDAIAQEIKMSLVPPIEERSAVVTRKNGVPYSLPEAVRIKREQVAAHHAKGMTDAEIAEAMGVKKSWIKDARRLLGLAANEKPWGGQECCGTKGKRHKLDCPNFGAATGATLPQDAPKAPEAAPEPSRPPKPVRGQIWECIECHERHAAAECPAACGNCGEQLLVQKFN